MNCNKDNFKEIYKPRVNHIVGGAPLNGTMFKTHTNELDYILNLVNDFRTHNRVWTVVKEDGVFRCIAGYHITNRIGYIVTEKPWDNDLDGFIFDLID